MELQLIQLAIKALVSDMEALKAENKEMKQEIIALKRQQTSQVPVQQEKQIQTDVMLGLLDARRLLGVSRNTFLKMVESGTIKPIRMNQRTIRYSKVSIMEFIENNRK
jgi:hypothetical protein